VAADRPVVGILNLRVTVVEVGERLEGASARGTTRERGYLACPVQEEETHGPGSVIQSNS
jgi:hypothetical protein